MAGEFLRYIKFILDEDILQLETLLSQIHEIKEYLQQYYWNVEKLESFLREFEEHFIVENGRVAVLDPELESAREKAVEYFEDQLSWYDESPHYMDFRGHVGQADRDVIKFINSFYPGEEFEDFLLGYPDVFAVFKDGSVNLIETESVRYFKSFIGNERISIYNFRYCISCAPDHIQRYINRCYPSSIWEFFENNSDVFDIEDDFVYVKLDE